jgi:hypothetical protein
MIDNLPDARNIINDDHHIFSFVRFFDNPVIFFFNFRDGVLFQHVFGEKLFVCGGKVALGALERIVLGLPRHDDPLPAQLVVDENRNLSRFLLRLLVLGPVAAVHGRHVHLHRRFPLEFVRTELAQEPLDFVVIGVLVELVELQVALPLRLEVAVVALEPIDLARVRVLSQDVLLQVGLELGLVRAVVTLKPLDLFGLGVVHDHVSLSKLFNFALNEHCEQLYHFTEML